MTTPLAGITVLDFGQIYQGPYATLLMAKGGANVIKIEPPGGEPLRRRVLATGKGDTTLPIAMLNANKRAITLNLKTERGRDLLCRMAARADVLLENFSPGTMDGLGVGYDVLRKVNPRLVYATGTGFGITGPDRDNLAMDFTIQAASGIMSVTGAADGPPMKAGPTLVDFMGGIHLYAAVITALYQRDHTGEGQLVEVAMQEAVYSSLAASYDYHHRTGNIPPRAGNRQAGLSSAPYNTFATTDGWVAIHVVTEGHWTNLLKAMGREDLNDDPRFRTNTDRTAHMAETEAVVTAWASTLPKMEVVAAAKRYRIPLRAGAQRSGGDERPAHARTRHAGADRAPVAGIDRHAQLAVAAAWRGAGEAGAEPVAGAAQHGDLSRLAGLAGSRGRRITKGRRDLVL